MSRERELAKIEADAGYITYPEEAPGKQLTFRENVHQAIEAAYKLGERIGRERAAEICKQDGCDACYDLIRQEPRTP